MSEFFFFVLFFFVLGLIFGSFYNVIGLRVPKNDDPFTDERSECPNCGHPLKWYELIPILSYVIQRGKCRSCCNGISLTYPMIELATASLFALSYMHAGLTIDLALSLLFVSMLIIIFVSDIAYMIIPNSVLLFFFPFFIVFRMGVPLDPWWSPIAGALLGGIITLLVILASGGGMGMGDMKLFVVLGVVLGLDKLALAFLLACIIGAVLGGILLGLKVIKRKQPFPFGPSIVMAALVAYFMGDGLLQWYFGLF